MNAYGDWVKGLRSKMQMTQIGFGKLIGVSNITIHRWEQGKKMPTPMARSRLKEIEASLTEDNKSMEDKWADLKILDDITINQALGVIQFLINNRALTVILERGGEKPCNICCGVVSANQNGAGIDLWIDETIESAASMGV